MNEQDNSKAASLSSRESKLRRPRTGCLPRLLSLIFVASILLNGWYFINQSSQRGPVGLTEEYVAGSWNPGADKIAVVRVTGLIALDTVNYAVRQIRAARDDQRVKAVVLRVDSPGGTVTGSDQIWRELILLKNAGKPIVVSMGGFAASGGYYVAAPADRIFAEPTTTTGSIGVILELPNASGLLDKVGVDFEAITAGEWKNMGSPFEPFEPRELERFQEMVDQSYERFLEVVASGRGISMSEVGRVAEGQVFTSAEALERNLIDELGYLEDAILQAKSLSGAEGPHKVIRYVKPFSFSSALFNISTQATKPSIDPNALMELRTPRMMMILR